MARAFSASIWIGLERLEVNVRVAEVVRGHGGPLPKSLDSDKNFKPEQLFGNLWTKKCLFWSKTVLLWQEVDYYMVYIAYYTE